MSESEPRVPREGCLTDVSKNLGIVCKRVGWKDHCTRVGLVIDDQ